MMKRILTILLSLLLLLSLMVGCASELQRPRMLPPAIPLLMSRTTNRLISPTKLPLRNHLRALKKVLSTKGDNAESFTSFNYDYFPIEQTQTITFWKTYENQYTNNDINHHSIISGWRIRPMFMWSLRQPATRTPLRSSTSC